MGKPERATDESKISLSRFCSLAPDATERAMAVRMAWDGYKEEERQGYGCAVTLLLMGLSFLILFIVGGFVFWGILLGGLILFAGIKWLLSVISVIKDEPSAKKRRKVLQLAASDFLKKGYLSWRERGLTMFGAGMERLISDQSISWKQVVAWPEPYVPQPATDEPFVKATFNEPRRVRPVGFMATSKSLMITPSSEAHVTSTSLFQSMAESVKQESKSDPMVDLFETAVKFAHQGSEDGEVVVYGLQYISCAELYFSEMVTTEYSARDEEIGELKVTMRDGRSFLVRANPVAALHIRDAIRSSKPQS